MLAADLVQAVHRYLAVLREHREALNRLNVYPVPDGDTGTNMTLTMESVAQALEGAEGMSEVTEAVARGSLMGAQGNSGIILSQILRGMADVFRGNREVSGADMAAALTRASEAAYRAVGRPVEGTILTVLRRAAEDAAEAADAEAADAAAGTAGVAGVLAPAYAAAVAALRDTPRLLPVLEEAGVVDAGGAGFLLLVGALLEEAAGTAPDLPREIFQGAAGLSGRGHERRGEPTVADLRYEVMFLLDGGTDAGEQLRDAWDGLGDSIVVVGGEGTWNCHIHTDDIGPAIEAGIAVGKPFRIVVTDLLEQAAEERFHAAVEFEPVPEARGAKVGMVAVAVGTGMVELFRLHGAQGVVVGGQTMNPSVGDLLEVVEAVLARTVVILPNNKNVIPAAEELDQLTRKQVFVIPTRSIPQGIAAVVPYAASMPADQLVPAMTRAAAGVRTGELTHAVRDASTPAGSIREGDWLGLVDGEVTVIRRGTGRAVALLSRVRGRLGGEERERRRSRARERDGMWGALIALVAATLTPDAEVVTLVTGAEADADVTSAAATWLSDHHPDLVLEQLDGGQPLYPYLVGVE